MRRLLGKERFITSVMFFFLTVSMMALNGCGGGGGGGAAGPNPAPPVANAGPDQKVKTGSLIALDGSGSGHANSYTWSFTSKPSGSTAALSDPTVSKPTFTADKNGPYVINLIVNDGAADATVDSVTITAATYDFGPIEDYRIDTSATCTPQTTIPGGNIINQTWTPAGSPYLIQGDITIPNGVTLTIQPGVTVCISSSDSQGGGVDPSRVELTVNGTLNVSGSATNPVIFRSVNATTSMSAWYGIRILTGGTSSIDYAYIANALYGIYSNQTPTVSNSVFMNNTDGVYLSVAGTIASSVFLKDGTGVYIGSGVSSQLTNLLIYQNSTYGVNLSNPLNVNIYNCTIDGNTGYGVYFSGGSSSTATIKNSIITNDSYGVYSAASGTISVSYSNVWGNTTNYTGDIPGTGSISKDPLYASTPINYKLSPGSPSIDAGTDLSGSVPTDILGTARPQGDASDAYDMGAYEM